MGSDVYKPPHMPWYERDFWSFRVRLLEPMARLMYRSLLQQGWHSERPPYLPANDEQLMKLADAPTREDWGRHCGPVLAMFEKTEDGRWYFHPKAVALMAKVTGDHETRRRCGQAGGRPTKAEQKLNNNSGNDNQKPTKSSAEAELLLSSSIQNQSKNQNQIQNQEALSSEPDASDGRPSNTTDSDLRTVMKSVARGSFEYYLEKTGRNRKTYTFTPKRERQVLARLGEEWYKLAEPKAEHATHVLQCVVDALCHSDFHMGRDPKTNGKRYCDWELLFGSRESFEKWMQEADEYAEESVPCA